MNNFINIKNRDTVKLAPWMLNKDYKTNILSILKSRYEGICSKFGYIKRNSIELIKVWKGTIEMSTFHGYVLFDVEFTASVCNPAIGSIVKCKVKNINVFGILCTSGIIEKGEYQNILNIIVPKQDSQFIENKQVLDNISVNDDVNVEILGKKYILNNKNINIFGKIIDTNKDKEDSELKNEIDDTNLELDDEADDIDDETGQDDILDEDNEENEEDDENEEDQTELTDDDGDDEIEEIDDDIESLISENDTDFY